jgi:hypothetical protein
MQRPVNNMQQLVSAATDMHTREELPETAFSTGFNLMLYSKHEL